MNILIRQVKWPTHKRELLAIRHAVFVEEQGVPIELEHDAHDADALHLLASDPQGTAVATARMLNDGHIGRMAVLSSWRGQGIGSELLRKLFGIAATRGHRDLFLNAQCEAESFYRRFGFQPQGEIFEDAGIGHRRMYVHLGNDDV